MTNRDVYAGGLLNRALDPETQPPEIRDFLRDEEALLRQLIPRGSRVVDFGCGEGRHLLGLRDHVSFGVGLDYEFAYVAQANRAASGSPLRFLVADGTAAPLRPGFDIAVCLTSTWGTMTDKLGVLTEMRRLARGRGTRLVTAYGPESVAPRTEWYARLGHEVTRVDDECMVAGGFRSEHFTETRLSALLGECVLHPLGRVGFLAIT